MAPTAEVKKGFVFLSLPAASGILVQPPNAATVCEFDLVRQNDQIAQCRAQTWIPKRRWSYADERVKHHP
jgi:hypothetical protein